MNRWKTRAWSEVLYIWGAGDNAPLNVHKNPAMSYNLWNDDPDTSISCSFNNLTLNATADISNMIGVSSNYRSGFSPVFDNCKITNWRLYHYYNGEGSLAVNECVFDGPGLSGTTETFNKKQWGTLENRIAFYCDKYWAYNYRDCLNIHMLMPYGSLYHVVLSRNKREWFFVFEINSRFICSYLCFNIASRE